MRIFSIVKNGKRVDIPQEELQKKIQDANKQLTKGGPGSGRYPAGSGDAKESAKLKEGDIVTINYKSKNPKDSGDTEIIDGRGHVREIKDNGLYEVQPVGSDYTIQLAQSDITLTPKPTEAEMKEYAEANSKIYNPNNPFYKPTNVKEVSKWIDDNVHAKGLIPSVGMTSHSVMRAFPDLNIGQAREAVRQHNQSRGIQEPEDTPEQNRANNEASDRQDFNSVRDEAGREADMEDRERISEMDKMTKGGPGSGRYPAGSGKGDEISNEVKTTKPQPPVAGTPNTHAGYDKEVAAGNEPSRFSTPTGGSLLGEKEETPAPEPKKLDGLEGEALEAKKAEVKAKMEGLIADFAKDPDVISAVKQIESGPKTTKGNYGRYMSFLSPYQKDRTALHIMSQAMKRAGGDAFGIDSAISLMTGSAYKAVKGSAIASSFAKGAPMGNRNAAKDYTSEGKESAEAKNISSEVLDETKKVYSDSFQDKSLGPRNLDWAGKETNASTFIEQAKLIRGYNEFNPEVAQKVVDTFGENATYRMGREASVVVYVKGGKQLPPKTEAAYHQTRYDLKADEFDKVPGTDEFRIWWD